MLTVTYAAGDDDSQQVWAETTSLKLFGKSTWCVRVRSNFHVGAVAMHGELKDSMHLHL
jgi:hypothetical protein